MRHACQGIQQNVQSAENQTFGARVERVGFTVFLSFSTMLLMFGILKVTGIASIDLFANMPIPVVLLNYLFDSNDLTVSQMFTSPFVIMGVLGIIAAAPLLEEVIFRGPCRALSDDAGKLNPKFLFVVLGWSFIMFGLAHGFGYFSVLVQGVGGLFLTLLWFRNGPSQLSSYLSCVVAHSLYNILVITTVWLMAS